MNTRKRNRGFFIGAAAFTASVLIGAGALLTSEITEDSATAERPAVHVSASGGALTPPVLEVKGSGGVLAPPALRVEGSGGVLTQSE